MPALACLHLNPANVKLTFAHAHTHPHSQTLSKQSHSQFSAPNKRSTCVWRAKSVFRFSFHFHHVSNAAIKCFPLNGETKMRNLVPFIIIVVIVVVVAVENICAYNKIPNALLSKIIVPEFLYRCFRCRKKRGENHAQIHFARNSSAAKTFGICVLCQKLKN